MKLLLLLCIVFYHYLSLSCLVYILFCFWEITFRLSLFRTAHLFCKSSFSRDRGKTLENNTKNWEHKENFREKKPKKMRTVSLRTKLRDWMHHYHLKMIWNTIILHQQKCLQLLSVWNQKSIQNIIVIVSGYCPTSPSSESIWIHQKSP